MHLIHASSTIPIWRASTARQVALQLRPVSRKPVHSSAQHAESESPLCASADVRQKTGVAATPGRVTRDQLRQNASRHRYHFAPPATPPGFWDMGFMDSQVFARFRFAASCDALPELVDGAQANQGHQAPASPEYILAQIPLCATCYASWLLGHGLHGLPGTP